jgi:uncharacterized protein YkvS
MSIARDISRQTRRSFVEVTSGNAGTNFTVSGGFSGSSLDVYLNGAKLIINSDYSLNGTSGIILNQAAVAGDIIEFVSRNTSSVINVVDTSAIIDEAVTFDKLSDSATESSNVRQRLATSWIYFNSSTGTPSNLTDYNVSTITDLNTGQYQINFSSPLSSNYCALVSMFHHTNVSYSVSPSISAITSNYVSVVTAGNTSNPIDTIMTCVATFGGR